MCFAALKGMARLWGQHGPQLLTWAEPVSLRPLNWAGTGGRELQSGPCPTSHMCPFLFRHWLQDVEMGFPNDTCPQSRPKGRAIGRSQDGVDSNVMKSSVSGVSGAFTTGEGWGETGSGPLGCQGAMAKGCPVSLQGCQQPWAPIQGPCTGDPWLTGVTPESPHFLSSPAVLGLHGACLSWPDQAPRSEAVVSHSGYWQGHEQP